MKNGLVVFLMLIFISGISLADIKRNGDPPEQKGCDEACCKQRIGLSNCSWEELWCQHRSTWICPTQLNITFEYYCVNEETICVLEPAVGNECWVIEGHINWSECWKCEIEEIYERTLWESDCVDY